MKVGTSRRRTVMALATVLVLSTAEQRAGTQETHLHVLKFADGQDVSHLNTLLATTFPEYYPAELTAAYLTRANEHGDPTPELAREVPTQRNGGISEDGKTVVFHLRDGLRWSDGSPLTATDAVYTTKLIIAKNSEVAATAGWDHIEKVDSPVAGEIRFELKVPYAPAVDTFFNVGNGLSILPERLLRGTDLRTAPFNGLPTGAGPFRYRRFARGDEIEMEANPYYFRGRPKLDRIIYKFVPNENTVTTQILTGELDLALAQPATQLRRTAEARDISVVRTPSARSSFLGFQMTRPPLNDRRVRLALRYGIDRTEIVKKLYDGAGSVDDDVVSQVDPFFGRGVGAATTDLKRASMLLDDAGWRLGAGGLRTRDGMPLTIDVVDFTGNDIALAVVELVRSQWSKIGVTLATRTLNGGTFYNPGGMAERGDFGAEVYGQSLTSETLLGAVNCGSVPPHGFNYDRYCNPQVDALLERAARTYDLKARAALYLRARQMIAADVPLIVIAHRQTASAIRSRVTGYRPNAYATFGDVLNLDVR